MVSIPAGRLQVATPETMAESIRSNTVATQAVDERIEPMLATVIADHPEVIDEAAAKAAALAQSDAGLVREDTESLDTQYARVAIDTARFIAEPDAMDRDGKTASWVLRNYANRQGKALLGATFWGDSMDMDFGGLGTSVPSVVNSLVPVPVTGRGVSGQSITEIALRQGGLNLFVTVAGGQIPASGSVAVTVLPSETWRTGSAWSFTGYLCGVLGTLAKDAADVWTFTRTAAGTAVAAPAESLWQSSQRTGAMMGQLLRGGRNSPNLDVFTRDLRAMVTRARAVRAPLIVRPVYNKSDEPAGSSGYNLIMSMNAAAQEIAGSDFVDTRGWLIRNGLAEMGITPTAQDLTDIGNDQIPSSLMHDTTHLNVPGRTAEGRFTARVMISKDWF